LRKTPFAEELYGKAREFVLQGFNLALTNFGEAGLF